MRFPFEVDHPLLSGQAEGLTHLPDSLSPDPILSAVDNYRGSFIDLDQNLSVDAAQLASERAMLARKFVGAGIKTGDRVVMAIGNGPLFVATLATLLEIGASPLLVYYQLPPAELQRTALRYGAVFVLTDGYVTDELAEIGPRHKVHETRWMRCVQSLIDSSLPGFCSNYPTLPGVPLHPTSGSTGLPKVAARPGPCAIAEAAHYIDTTVIDQRDALLVVTPMSHAYAYGMGLMVPLLSHATVLSMRRFILKKVLSTLNDLRVTVFPAVPAMLDMLLFGKGGDLLAKPRMVLSAGVPLTRRTVENFQRITGKVICPLYGTTETGGITVGTAGVSPEHIDSVGNLMRGVEARVEQADASLGQEVGRVDIRSSSMMSGYLSANGLDASALRDGWFLTGDLGRVGSDGTVELLGRESEMINVSGMKVAPSEVEEVLAQFPGVIECKVYAGERRTGSQNVKAVIVAPPSLDIAELKAYCQEQLVYYKRPQVIARLDAMPRSPAGKILKDQLP